MHFNVTLFYIKKVDLGITMVRLLGDLNIIIYSNIRNSLSLYRDKIAYIYSSQILLDMGVSCTKLAYTLLFNLVLTYNLMNLII